MPLFEVEIMNRVIKKSFAPKPQRIRGRQGEWYKDKLYYLADSEDEAKEFAFEEIMKRKIIGVTSKKSRKLKRDIRILDVRRLA